MSDEESHNRGRGGGRQPRRPRHVINRPTTRPALEPEGRVEVGAIFLYPAEEAENPAREGTLGTPYSVDDKLLISATSTIGGSLVVVADFPLEHHGRFTRRLLHCAPLANLDPPLTLTPPSGMERIWVALIVNPPDLPPHLEIECKGQLIPRPPPPLVFGGPPTPRRPDPVWSTDSERWLGDLESYEPVTIGGRGVHPPTDHHSSAAWSMNTDAARAAGDNLASTTAIAHGGDTSRGCAFFSIVCEIRT